MSDLVIQFTAFSDEAIEGWAYDPADVQRRLVFALSVDGLFERRVKVNLRRRGPGAEIGNPRIGFNATLPPVLRDGHPHLVQLHEIETGRLLREETVATRSIHFPDLGGGVAYATVTAMHPRHIRGWAVSAAGPVTVELEIDGLLAASRTARDPVMIDREHPAGFSFARLPPAFYDGAVHDIAVYARLARRTLIGRARVELAPTDAPRLEASAVDCADGIIQGYAVDPRMARRPLTLALLADGVEIARAETSPASAPPGLFRFDLTGPAPVDWLAAELRLVSLPDGMALPLAGHTVRDRLRVRHARAQEQGWQGLLIDSPLPLPALLPVELAADDGFACRAVLHGAGRMQLTMPLGADVLARPGLRVSIAGIVRAIAGDTSAVGPPRRLGAFVPPLRDLTRRVLSAFVRGEREPARGTSGAWRLRGRTRLEGWAVDLAAPEQPVEVVLLGDGQPVAAQTADRLAVPREAQIEAALPLGFSFDLTGLDARVVEARIAGGAPLLPAAPQVLPAVDPAVAVLRGIDELVGRGDLAAAYLRARAAAAAGSADIVDRFLLLDFALRATWSQHAAFLAAWAERASLGFAERLAEGRMDRLDLPPAYQSLLHAAPTDAAALAERAMLWSVLSQLPDDAQARPGEVVLVLGFARQAVRPVARALAAFERAGGHIAEAVPAEPEGLLVVHLAAPRLISPTAVAYWPALMAARGGGSPTCAQLAAEASLSEAGAFELLGRLPDAAIRLPAAGPAELLTFAVAVPEDDPWPFVVRDTAGADAVVADLVAAGAPETTAVILRRPGIAYPPDYEARALAAFRQAGGDRSVVPAALDYDPRAAAFVAGERMPARSFLGLADTGCFLLADLVRSRRMHGALGEDGIVVATAHPFAVASLGLAGMLPATADRAAHTKGFHGHLLGGWLGAAAAAGMAEPVDVPVARSAQKDAAAGTFRFATVRRFARAGHVATARDMVLACLDDTPALLAGDATRCLDLLQAVKLLGLQPAFHRRAGLLVPLLAARFPRAILPIFEVVAVSARPDEVAALIGASLGRLSLRDDPAPVMALAIAAVRFLTADALMVVLATIDDSPHRDLLHDPELAAQVGRVLLSTPEIAVALPFTGLRAETFRAAVPPLRQMTAALDAGDRTRFLAQMAVARHRDDPRSIVLALRTHTAELRALDLQPGEIALPETGDPDQCRRLAAVLGEALAGDDAAAIVAASRRGDLGPLTAAFAGWAAPYGVQPMVFEGESIEALFGAFTAAPLPPEAPSRGRVSVLLTVYNPDLRLLALSLRSLCRQTYRDIEVILVDDASDAVDPAAIQALAGTDPRIACLRLPRNVGPYAARNRALALASGRFVCIQDGDDYAHPQRIETQVAQLEAVPAAMLCTTAHLRIDAHAALQFEHTLDLRGDGTMTSMYRRSLFDSLGPFAAVRSRGDVEYRERVAASCGRHALLHVDCPLMFCFATPASLSNSVAWTMPAYLGLYRDAFAKRLRYPVVGGRRVGPYGVGLDDDSVVIPWLLRAET